MVCWLALCPNSQLFKAEKYLLYIFGVLSVSLDLLVPAPLWRTRKVYVQGSTV